MKGIPRKNTPEAFDLTKPIFNTKEAAAFLQITTRTLKAGLHQGTIPGRKVGREWRLSREELERMFTPPDPTHP